MTIEPSAISLSAFIDPVALGLVLGGTALVTVLRTPAGDLGRAVRALRVLGRRPFNATPALAQIGAWDRIARRAGVMALDRSVIVDPDLAAGVAAIVDGEGAEATERLLSDRIQARLLRHRAAADVWAGAAEAAPAMGMIGTLIGLVQLFTAMQDPAAIGGAMAVALLTTLYGALLATLVLSPIAARLRRMAAQEAAERLRLQAPLAALAQRERPRTRMEAA
jgi:chemotaxis protein MotA